MFSEFFLQKNLTARAGAWLGLGVFLGHKVFKTWMKYAINDFYKDFYDLLGKAAQNATNADDTYLEEMRGKVFDELLVFAAIVSPAILVHPLAGLIRNWWVFSWRRTLMAVSYTHLTLPTICSV